MLVGAHMSISGGLHKAIERGIEAKCEALQIFTKNSNQWKAKPILQNEVEEFKKKKKEWGNYAILVHGSYLINLSSPVESDRQKSIFAFIEEIERCDQLSIPYLIFHPGSHLGAGEEEGCRAVSRSLDQIFTRKPDFKAELLMETTAGQGSNIGYKFEHFKKILASVNSPKRMGICIDTCHIFAAGYDIRRRDGYENTFKDFDRIVGVDKIKAFHVNDSKKEFLSRVDRHEHIGKGFIGLDAFRFLLNDPRFEKLPMVIETPKGETMKEDEENLTLLRSLGDNKAK